MTPTISRTPSCLRRAAASVATAIAALSMVLGVAAPASASETPRTWSKAIAVEATRAIEALDSWRATTDPSDYMTFVRSRDRAATLTAIVGVTHPAFILLDPLEQQRRVTSWGRVLATACRSGRIATVQVMERTLPDSGKGLTAWWTRHGHHDDSWAATTYGELIHRAGPAGERHASTISIALDMGAAARAIRAAGGGNTGAATVLRQEMSTITAALRAADLTPSPWLEPGDLALILRGAYDPSVAAALERHGDLGRDLATAGPVAVTETWSSLRSDSAHHAVLWISEWPRSQVYPGTFLAPLLLTTGIQRSFSLICTPMRTDQAVRDIRKKKVEYVSDASQRARIGQIEDAGQTAEYQDVLRQESDLTAGHGVLRYTGLVSVSAETVDELEAAVSAIEQAAIQSSCETRRLVGQQAVAFIQPQRLFADAGQLGRHGILPDRHAGHAPPGAQEVPRDDHAAGQAEEHHREGGVIIDTREPPGAIGNAQVLQDDPQGLAEAEYGYGEVVAPQLRPQGGHPDDEAHRSRRRRARRQGQRKGHGVVVGQNGRGVGADADEGGVAEGEQPRKTREYGEAQYGYHVYAGQHDDGKYVVHG